MSALRINVRTVRQARLEMQQKCHTQNLWMLHLLQSIFNEIHKPTSAELPLNQWGLCCIEKRNKLMNFLGWFIRAKKILTRESRSSADFLLFMAVLNRFFPYRPSSFVGCGSSKSYGQPQLSLLFDLRKIMCLSAYRALRSWIRTLCVSIHHFLIKVSLCLSLRWH